MIEYHIVTSSVTPQRFKAVNMLNNFLLVKKTLQKYFDANNTYVSCNNPLYFAQLMYDMLSPHLQAQCTFM